MKLKIGLIYGGDSFEHDISCLTAESILKNIDRDLFDVKEIYIPKSGKIDFDKLSDIDLAFLAVHGPNCEDGELQKVLEENNIKYTGSGVTASALNMNKAKMHSAFKNAGLPVVKYLSFTKFDSDTEIGAKTEAKIGYPCFIKPNNAGSSIGISKAKNIHELRLGIVKAFKYDDDITVEEAIKNPREIEIGILGNKELILSKPGEVLSEGQFYSFDAKYSHPFKTTIKTNLGVEKILELKKIAERAYKTTGCCGYARIDFLLDEKENIFISEINTLPGFTKISQFPKLMEATGIKYKDLITKIINLAIE
jgi:D-alanine-D-alanine ligase